MVFLGLGSNPKDNDEYVKLERRFDQAKRERFLKEQEDQRERNAREDKSKDGKKKTRKEKFKEGFIRVDRGLSKATDKGLVVYRKVGKGLEGANLKANKFAEAAETFSIAPDQSLYGFHPEKLNPPTDMYLVDDRYGKKAGPVYHDGLDMFSVSSGKKGHDGLDAAFGLTPSRSKHLSPRNDPLHQMFGSVSQSSRKGKGKRGKESYSWI